MLRIRQIKIEVTKFSNEVLKEAISKKLRIDLSWITSFRIVVGSGPAGLFTGYLLAKSGYRPLILERGEKVEDRIKTVEQFWKTGKLNTDSNVQFGEGGAGTFSDGKLNTLVNDAYFRKKKVLETFVECGAPSDIL